MGRRAVHDPVPEPETTTLADENGNTSTKSRGPLTSAQRLAASSASSNEVTPELYAREGKHFTEIRVLHRDVRIVLLNNLFSL